MKTKRAALRLACAMTAMGMGWATVRGVPPASNGNGPVEMTLVVSPMATATPALEFRLLPPEQDVEKGNAAPRYLEALVLLPKTSNEDTDVIDRWLKAPLGELDEAAAEAKVTEAASLLRLTAAAARTAHADWEIDLRREGMQALLPHLNPLRKIANILALAIRLDIKRHRWAEARDKLQTGFALARHVGEGDTLIESLVGIAAAGRMQACLVDWVEEPGSPNLFWPLCQLPMPFNDLQHPLAMEQAWVYFQIPVLQDFLAGRYSVEGWYRMVDGLTTMNRLIDTGNETIGRQGIGLLVAMADYPQAKAALIARGAKPEEVERRPVAAVLEEFTLLRLNENAEEVAKWNGLPAPQVISAMDATQAKPGGFVVKPQSFADMVSRAMVPSFGNARFIAARLDRRIAMLRIVEALRAYAAEKGALPESLEAMTVPLPQMDPATGKAFIYEREGAEARLASPAMKDRGREDVWRVTIHQ